MPPPPKFLPLATLPTHRHTCVCIRKPMKKYTKFHTHVSKYKNTILWTSERVAHKKTTDPFHLVRLELKVEALSQTVFIISKSLY